jgi:hypothetical protein
MDSTVAFLVFSLPYPFVLSTVSLSESAVSCLKYWGEEGYGTSPPETLCAPRQIEIRGFSEIVRFALLTRCPEESQPAHGDLTARHLKKETESRSPQSDSGLAAPKSHC